MLFIFIILIVKRKENSHPEIKNKKAFHDYEICETFEAGIILCGTEVKSVKLGHAQINEAFVRSDKRGNIILFNAQIDEYHFGNMLNHDPKRQRTLLLHKREVKKIRDALEKDGMTAIPLKMYVTHGLIKVLFGLGKGKKLYDKRDDIAKRDAQRNAQRAIKDFNR